MPLPRKLARINRRFANPLLRPLTSHLRGFGVLEHVGRRTGRRYRTPLMVWARPAGFVVALTYGEDVDWLHNARAAGGAILVTRGRRYRVGSPRDLPAGDALESIPLPVRTVLGLVGVSGFVEFPLTHSNEEEPSPTPGP